MIHTVSCIRSSPILLCGLMAVVMIGGCGFEDKEKTDRLLRDAAERIESLETRLAKERQAYSNNYQKLVREFKTESVKHKNEIADLNKRIEDMQTEIGRLRKSAKRMQGYIALLQQRLETIREMKDRQPAERD